MKNSDHFRIAQAGRKGKDSIFSGTSEVCPLETNQEETAWT